MLRKIHVRNGSGQRRVSRAAANLRSPTLPGFARTATVTASVRSLQAGSNRRKQSNHKCNDYPSALEGTVQHSFSLTSPQEVAVIAVTPLGNSTQPKYMCA